jgi:taurine transport system substrate-binding protein
MRNSSITLVAVLLCALVLLPAAARAQEPVTVAYQLIYNPWKVPMVTGEYEKNTGREIEFRKFDTAGKVMTGLASGDVQIGLLGSAPAATALSRDIGVELFWIIEVIKDAEALVVRDGSGIVAPQDLRGKKMAMPFTSTTHFHTMFALEQFGIPASEVQILNMSPNAVVAAWERGDIDATFIWDPALSRVKDSGKVLLTSGLLGNWGKPTFDALVVNSEFAEANPDFMARFVKTIADIDADYRNNTEDWTPESEMVQAIVQKVGGTPEDVPGVLALYEFPDMAAQTSCTWLGCGEDSGAAKAIKATAKFLAAEGKIPAVKESYADDVTPKWVERAMQLD